MWKRIPRTTVGRFWGYMGVMLALGASLAGNIQSARLHTPDVAPTNTEFAFAGIPPLVAFISIELVNHNPWGGVSWGKYITRVLLFVVAPGSALVSFAHLTLVGLDASDVVVPGDTQSLLNIATAVLTALLIDGMILGGTGALLLPVKKPERPQPQDHLAPRRPVARPVDSAIGQILAEEATRVHSVHTSNGTAVPSLTPARPRAKAILAPQASSEERDRKRWPPREHPLWDEWATARESGTPWTPEDMILKMKDRMHKVMNIPAAQQQIRRWEAVADEPNPQVEV